MYLYQITYDRNVCRFIIWFSCLSMFYRFFTTVLVQTQYHPTEIQTKIKAWEPNRVCVLSLSKDPRKSLRFLNKHESYVLKKHWAILSIGFFPRILPRIRLSQTIFFCLKTRQKQTSYVLITKSKTHVNLDGRQTYTCIAPGIVSCYRCKSRKSWKRIWTITKTTTTTMIMTMIYRWWPDPRWVIWAMSHDRTRCCKQRVNRAFSRQSNHPCFYAAISSNN